MVKAELRQLVLSTQGLFHQCPRLLSKVVHRASCMHNAADIVHFYNTLLCSTVHAWLQSPDSRLQLRELKFSSPTTQSKVVIHHSEYGLH